MGLLGPFLRFELGGLNLRGRAVEAEDAGDGSASAEAECRLGGLKPDLRDCALAGESASADL